MCCVNRGSTNCNQKSSPWCWAISATMAASALGEGNNCVGEKADFANHQFLDSYDSSWSSCCNKGNTTFEIADGFKFLPEHSYSAGGALSQSGLDGPLRTKRCRIDSVYSQFFVLSDKPDFPQVGIGAPSQLLQPILEVGCNFCFWFA